MLSVPHKIPSVCPPPAIHIPVFTDIFPSTFFVQMLSLITHYSILKAHYSKASGNVKRLPLQPIRDFQTPLLCGRSKQRMKFVYSAALRREVLRGWNFKIFHNFLFFAWIGNVPTLDIWGSATESRALLAVKKCLRPRKYHFSAVRNARNWGNTIFQPWEMSATEEIPFFNRVKCPRLSRRPISAVSEGGNHHLPRNFKEQKFKSHWCRAAFLCSFQ